MLNNRISLTVALILTTSSLLNAQKNFLPVSLRNWEIRRSYGGKISLNQNNKKILRLTTERNIGPDKRELWRGAFIWNRKAPAVVPGISYTFSAEIRSDTSFQISLFEYQEKYSVNIKSQKNKSFSPSNTDWKTYKIEYTPSSDNISYIRPGVEINGWRKRLEIRNISITQKSAAGNISIKSQIFITSPGKSIPFVITSSSPSIKLLLYGPDGTSGDGSINGGSGAWSDHFKDSYKWENTNKAKIFRLHLPPNAIEGTYRLVAVNHNDNALAQTEFNVYPEEISNKILSLTKKINLPQNTKIIFIGDSLTDLFRGRNYVSLIERALKWLSNDKIKVFNAGVGGDNIKKIAARLKKDVINHKPDIVFIFEGANDIKRRYNPKINKLGKRYVPQKEYEKSYQLIIDNLKNQTKAKIIIATCAPADQNIRKAFHKQAKEFGDQINFYGLPEDTANAVQAQKKLASDNNLALVDINKRLTHYLKQCKQTGRQYPHVDDGVHLSEYGNREVAIYFLEYLAETFHKMPLKEAVNKK